MHVIREWAVGPSEMGVTVEAGTPTSEGTSANGVLRCECLSRGRARGKCFCGLAAD